MMDVSNFAIERVTEENNIGVFKIRPLPRGYGHTVANPIRRILLSSLSGGAITAIKITGVDHEYSTLEGVQDDILSIILRLKNIPILSHSDDVVTLKINVSSKKGETVEVTSKDIQVDSSVEIADENVFITSVTDGSSFEAELTVEKGTGFKVADSASRSEIGVIPVDGAFSPIENVEVKIENTRVGQRTDLDQITFTIKTNGTIAPSQALEDALQIHNDVTNKLYELSQGSMEIEEEVVEEGDNADDNKDPEIPVKNLSLSTRLRNALLNSAITDLRQLDGKTSDDIMEIKGMGKKSADELIDIMKNNNLEIIE